MFVHFIANNLYFLLNGRLRTTEERTGSGSIKSNVDYGRGMSVGFAEAYQVSKGIIDRTKTICQN